MFCTRCGTELTSTSTFCSACGAPIGPGLDPAVIIKRPGLITLLAVLHIIGSILFLILGVLGMVIEVGSAESDAPFGLTLAAVLVLFGIASLACGIGLWTMRPYGRTLQIALAGIGLLAIPVGTIISGLILYYMWRPGIRALFSGKPDVQLTRAELAAIAEVTQGSAAMVAVVVGCLVIGGVFLLGIVAAIAVPGLLRARMAANEAAAIGSMRSILSAQASYASAAGSGGYATRLATLATPCPGTGQGFIASDLAQDPSVKSGYTVMLQSAGADPGPLDCNGVPTESDFYATAEPVKFENTGVRAFSASATGTLYYTATGVAPSFEATRDGSGTPVR